MKNTQTASNKVKFTATLGQIEIKSRGAKLGLLVPESDLAQVSQMISARMPNVYLEVSVTIKQKKIEIKKPEKQVKRVRRSRFGKYQDTHGE